MNDLSSWYLDKASTTRNQNIYFEVHICGPIFPFVGTA